MRGDIGHPTLEEEIRGPRHEARGVEASSGGGNSRRRQRPTAGGDDTPEEGFDEEEEEKQGSSGLRRRPVEGQRFAGNNRQAEFGESGSTDLVEKSGRRRGAPRTAGVAYSIIPAMGA